MAKVFPLLRPWVSQIGANSESRARIGFRSYSNRARVTEREKERGPAYSHGVEAAVEAPAVMTRPEISRGFQ